MFDFLASVVHPSELLDWFMVTYTVHLMANVVHQSSLGKGT